MFLVVYLYLAIVGTFLIILQDFVTNEGGGEAPLEGSIPDMTSSTELVTKPIHIFQNNFICFGK